MSTIEEIKQVSNLTDEDRQLLQEMEPALRKHAEGITERFYEHLESFEHLRNILHAEEGRIDLLKGHLNNWLISLADGTYGEAYYERRYRIGKRHVEVGLEPRYVIAAMAFCRGVAARYIVEADYADDPQKEARTRALNRVMDIDLNIMLQSYDDHRISQFLEVTGFSKELFDNMMSGMF
jgi:hemoglobin-like flavoprotein